MPELIVLVGVPGSGKSTFYESKFIKTHERISLDLISGRKREDKLLDKYTNEKLNIVIDNTNPSAIDRMKYIRIGKHNNYKVICYFLDSTPEESKKRNSTRSGKKRVPDIAIDVIQSRLEKPSYEEGIDEIWNVKISNNKFIINRK
ncbi:MAG: ATP-binding protein [Saprospiraceae bacterium]|nr:ATP-binding protein [Saprospiraceae bacterium]MBK7699572.1 ATP-binding protein [Saprospiraceae bacterium]MBK8825665.1 ATP-binding protein [Saprospiraceae bacterium]